MKEEYLRIDNGIKQTGGIADLYGIYLQIFKGETCGIISGNMKDIEVLVEILSGKAGFTQAAVYYKGSRVTEQTKWQRKIAVIDQHSHLVNHLSIAENIYIVHDQKKGFFVNYKNLNRQLESLLQHFGIPIMPDQKVGRLNYLERCQIELLKAFVTGTECVLIDYRFHYFIGNEFEELYETVRKLKGHGMTFIMVDYVISQVMQFADSLMLLHKGKTTGILDRVDFKEDDIRKRLLGELHAPLMNNAENKYAETALAVKGLVTRHLDGIEFQIRHGEIVTIVMEKRNKLEDLCEVLRGRNKAWQGQILINGKAMKVKGFHHALRQGICFIENNPVENNLFSNLNVYDNICIAKGRRARKLWYNRRYKKHIINGMDELFGKDINESNLYNLSEDELHKIIYYRVMLYHPEVIIYIEPFSTVDIHIAAMVQDMIVHLAKKGIGILILAQNDTAVKQISSAVYSFP